MINLPNNSEFCLNNSVYLSKETQFIELFNKTQEILQEESIDSNGSINETTKFKPMKYNKYETLFINTNLDIPNNKTFQNSLEESKLREFQANNKSIDNLSQNQIPTTRKPVNRLCRQRFCKAKLQLAECLNQVDQKWRKKRDQLASRSRTRRIEAFERMRRQTYEQILLQCQQDAQSVIQQQVDFEQIEMRQFTIMNFLSRQKFHAQENKILNQMRQFCLYGSIKVEGKLSQF